MTAPVSLVRSPLLGDSDSNTRVAAENERLRARIAELEQQLQDATDALTGCRQSVDAEQDAHQMTRLLGRDHTQPARRDLSALVADTAQSLTGIAERRGAA